MTDWKSFEKSAQWDEFFVGKSYDETEQAILEALAQGLPVHGRSDKDESLLHAAARFGHSGVARIALSHGLDVNCVCRPKYGLPGATPIRLALEQGHGNIVSLLIEHGANEANVDTHETLFDACLRFMYIEPFWLLIFYGRTELKKRHQANLSCVLANQVPLRFTYFLAPKRSTCITDVVPFLESFLQGALCKDVIPRIDAQYCPRCVRGLSEETTEGSQLWRERLQRVQEWRGDAFTFNYGFLPRCVVCRSALLQLERSSYGISRALALESFDFITMKENLCDGKTSQSILRPRLFSF